MKAVTTEQIKFMRAKYEEKLGANDPLVQVINECLEYRYAEEEFAAATLRQPRTPLEVECGPSTIAMMMDHVGRKVQ